MKNDFYIPDREEALTDKEYEYIPVKIKPCPLCGRIDALSIQRKDDYDERFTKNKGACLSLSCHRCDLDLKVFDHSEADSSYEYMRGALIGKWNARKEANDESEES